MPNGKPLIKIRVIPCLLLDGRGLVKTVRFKDPKYVGDPINAVKIFNNRFVDEVIFLDISASRDGHGPDFDHIAQITSECFIPFCYGGGIRSIDDAERLFSLGVEKIAVNTTAIENPTIIARFADKFGIQSVVAAMDVKKGWLKDYTVMTKNGTTKTDLSPVGHALKMERLGAGELLINSVDRDGTMKGYDVNLIKKITDAVNIPVIACGGAGHLEHLAEAVRQAGVQAVAAGSLFVFKGKHRAVLINYPDQSELRKLLV